MSDNVIVATLKYILVEVLWDIIYFPIWWYTKGLKRVFDYCIRSASEFYHRKLALKIWLSSMFKPMYGDYTKEGRIISIMMRLIILGVRLVMLVIWLVVLVLLFISWLILPILIIYYILFQVFEVPFIFFELT